MFGFHGIGLPVPSYPPGEIPWQQNGTWVINSAGMINMPTLGSELLTDPGIEAWTTPTNATNYTENLGGTGTVNQETSVIHGGSNAVRIDIDGAGLSTTFVQSFSGLTIGAWVMFSAWLRSSTTGKSARMDITSTTGAPQPLSMSYAQCFQSGRLTSASSSVTLARNSATSSSIYGDDWSLKYITLNTLYAVRTGPSLPASVQATGTINPGTWCGVVYGLDSIATPTNLIQAVHDGGTGIRLQKCVAGTWTDVLSTTATYVAGVLPQIRWVSANTFALYYNGTQRGANQTISDAGTGTLYGVFSTSALNTITGFSVG